MSDKVSHATEQLEVIRATEAMLSRLMNAKGRIIVQPDAIKNPWWKTWVIPALNFLLGGLVFTLGWVWSGKAEIDNIKRLIQSRSEVSESAHNDLTNHVNHGVRSLGYRVNRIAGQAWTKDQMYVWGQELRRSNTNMTELPEIDQIRQHFPMQLE